MKPESTKVLFRKSSGNEVVAIFPQIPGTNSPYDCLCYFHIGQHGTCGIGWYQSTRAASPKEYVDLKAELEGIGYILDVRHKWTRKDDEIRKKEIQSTKTTK